MGCVVGLEDSEGVWEACDKLEGQKLAESAIEFTPNQGLNHEACCQKEPGVFSAVDGRERGELVPATDDAILWVTR